MNPNSSIPKYLETALIFPGQGAFYPGALQNIQETYPFTKNILLSLDAVVVRRLGQSLLKTMGDEKSTPEYLLKSSPDILQLAIYAVSVTCYEVLRSQGVSPHVLMGHSFGEIAALCCAGVYTYEQGAEIACDRIQSLAESAPAEGRMAAISARSEHVETVLQAFAASRPALAPAFALAIAVENHDGQTVVSGKSDEVSAFIGYCALQNLSGMLLHAPYSFHHIGLRPAAFAFEAQLKAYRPAPLHHFVYSPILGRFYENTDDFGACLAQHLTLPVKFSSAVKFLKNEGVTTYIECGALDVLSKIVLRTLGPKNIQVFSSLKNKIDEIASISHIVQYFSKGKNMNTRISQEALMPEFERFWAERGPIISSMLKAEFLRFLEQNQLHRLQIIAPPVQTESLPLISPISMPAAAVSAAVVPVHTIPRPQLFNELINMYAQAMEYPAEVFNETVELEAELGIDSVKQMELIGRIREQYSLPPLPTNFRASDFKTMGQIVSYVFSEQKKGPALG